MMFIRALQYLYFYHCYPPEAIENDNSCLGRRVPSFLVEGEQSQCLFSVSYNWGGFDSVEMYSRKVEQMKAGNINTAIPPLLSCATGVDCSGFISKIWGLKTKWGTGQIFQQTSSIDISKMKVGDVFVKPNAHVIMFTGNLNDNITTIESVVRPGKVISSQYQIKWFLQHGYTPKIAYNACENEPSDEVIF